MRIWDIIGAAPTRLPIAVTATSRHFASILSSSSLKESFAYVQHTASLLTFSSFVKRSSCLASYSKTLFISPKISPSC